MNSTHKVQPLDTKILKFFLKKSGDNLIEQKIILTNDGEWVYGGKLRNNVKKNFPELARKVRFETNNCVD